MFRLIAPVLLLLAPGSCGTEPTPPSASEVQVEFVDGKAPLNKHFGFKVDVGDRPLADVDADMPGHGHGIRTDPSFERLEDGRWQIEGMLLHMPGSWEFYFDVRNEDGTTERLVYPFEVDFE